MKKWNSFFLIVLFANPSVYPEQRQCHTQEQDIVAYLKKEYLRPASSYIKRQYQDKHKRRAWLTAGIVCIITFFSWRLGALKRMMHYHQSNTKKEEKPSDFSSHSINSSEKKEEEAHSAPQDPFPNPSGTLIIKSDKEEEEETKTSSSDDTHHKADRDLSLKDPAILGAEALEAALKTAGVRVDKKRLYRILDSADTNYIVPLLRENSEQTKTEIQEKCKNDGMPLKDEQLQHAAEKINRETCAQEKFSDAAKKNDFSAMIDALLDGATIDFTNEFFTAISTKNSTLSKEQQIALDCLLWHLGPPEQVKQTLWQRTIKRITESSYKSIPQDLFNQPRDLSKKSSNQLNQGLSFPLIYNKMNQKSLIVL